MVVNDVDGVEWSGMVVWNVSQQLRSFPLSLNSRKVVANLSTESREEKSRRGSEAGVWFQTTPLVSVRVTALPCNNMSAKKPATSRPCSRDLLTPRQLRNHREFLRCLLLRKCWGDFACAAVNVHVHHVTQAGSPLHQPARPAFVCLLGWTCLFACACTLGLCSLTKLGEKCFVTIPLTPASGTLVSCLDAVVSPWRSDTLFAFCPF